VRIDSVSTGPQFKSNVKFIYNERYGKAILENKPFGEFVDKLAKNGKNSTVVFIPEKENLWIWDRFLAVPGIKDRKTGEWISYEDLKINYHKDYMRVYDKDYEQLHRIVKFTSIEPQDNDFKQVYSALNGLDHGYLNIYVTDEIDGKIHLAHSTLRADQNADMAAFKYLAAESILPDNPISVDSRLNKYLNPKPESRVTLLYEDSRNDLYNNKDFIGFIEWLDNIKSKKDNQNIIVKPWRRINKDDKLNFIDVITIEQYPFESNGSKCRNILQNFYKGLLWHGFGFDSAKIKNNLNWGSYGDKSTYPDIIKPFNVCV